MVHPTFNPVALKIGPLQIYWYGVSYLLGFAGAFGDCYRRRNSTVPNWNTQQICDLVFYTAIGVIFGGSIGYWLFYEPQLLLEEPFRMLRFWEPGRSFHGGLLGVMVALLLFARVSQRHFLEICDFITPAVPIGLAMGRIGNFLNGELWGRVTNLPWGMVFQNADHLPRHPSQLYEFALEGVMLFIIMQWYIRKPRSRGAVSAVFFIGYGVFRFIAEFFREPDARQGFIGFGLTMGQLLSLPMLLVGLAVLLYTLVHPQR